MDWLLCQEARNCFICQKQNVWFCFALGVNSVVFKVLQFLHFCLQQSPGVIQLQRKLNSGDRMNVDRPLSQGRQVVGSTSLGWPGLCGFFPWSTDFIAHPEDKHVWWTTYLWPGGGFVVKQRLKKKRLWHLLNPEWIVFSEMRNSWIDTTKSSSFDLRTCKITLPKRTLGHFFLIKLCSRYTETGWQQKLYGCYLCHHCVIATKVFFFSNAHPENTQTYCT